MAIHSWQPPVTSSESYPHPYGNPYSIGLEPRGRPPPFSLLVILALLSPLRAQAQSYYYVEPYPGEAASISPTNVTCDSTVIGAIRYNAGTAAFEGCNGTAWSTFATAAGTTGQVQFNSGGVLGANAKLFWDNVNGRLGINQSAPGATLDVKGTLRLSGATSGYVGFAVPAAAGSATYTLPSAVPGTSGYVLSSDTSGNLSWAASGGIPATPVNSVQFNSGGAFGGSANFTFNLATGTLTAVNHDTTASTGTYKLGGTTVLAYPDNDATSIGVGQSALFHQNTTGDNNTAVGTGALLSTTNGSGNTAVGYYALSSNTGNNRSTAVGQYALTTATGGSDDALGYQAGQYITTGTSNVALGELAMQGISGTPLIGSNNTAVGNSALLLAQGAGKQNTALGKSAGAAITTGTDNTLLGYTAGNVVTGNSNIVVGEAGNITTGGSNILIGNSLTGTTATSNSQLDIGDLITGTIGSGLVTIAGTGAITVPSGTTAQRPGTPVNGMLRYNSTIYAPEVYAGGGWQPVSTVLAQRYVSASHTGNTAETALATISIPANTMSANACLRVTTQWEVTNNADAKTLYMRFSATSGAPNGTAFMQGSAASTSTLRFQFQICNQNATNSQIGFAASASSFGNTNASPITGAIDTTATTYLNFDGQLGTSTDTVTLDGYTVELVPF